jgi:predicted MFS family arabinose efflux permease
VTVAEVFPQQERARAKSFLISTVFLGNAVGSGMVALTVIYLGWRGTLHILALVGMVVATILWLALRGGMAGQKKKRRAPQKSAARTGQESHCVTSDSHLVLPASSISE